MTTTTTNAPVQTAADLLAQAGNIGADLATSVPTTQVPADAGLNVKEVIAETTATGIDAVKNASDKAMGFVAEHKTGFIIGAGVAVAAGAGYGLYKWHKNRQEKKADQAKEAAKAAAEAFKEAVKAAFDAAAENK